MWICFRQIPTIQYVNDAAGNITSIQQLASILYGDVNDDAAVNITDAVLVLKFITNSTLIINSQAADVNGDEFTNITDAVLILKHITNIDVPFSVEQ